MTRLFKTDIDTITAQMNTYDSIFQKQTGYTMEEIARKAANIHDFPQKPSVAAIPVTSGLGIISGFAQTVAAILHHCHVDAEATPRSDVTGLQLACQNGRQIAFMADDDTFTAIGTSKPLLSDNGYATGQGFATALCAAMKSRGIAPRGKEALVLGAGPVGTAAAQTLMKAKMKVAVYDIDIRKSQRLAETIRADHCLQETPDYRSYRYIVDATTAGDFIDDQDVTPDTIIAAPGMPRGVSDAACQKATVIHNTLELGVMTMYYQCVRQMEDLQIAG
ncbi:MAG: 3-methylornithyl-N6-L-lysine dehydrogenase PylD [Eubacteriaceae bacterium]|jgi:pyrrolysine biosynthesis protein PylD|nr:3-methylornithyl-N6-L-lysine dehydrogenase PylD [Eubacteriaceae bacterium]MDD4508250.1 3-methylornithyl-N6-L-lysine dehydrogenase PylD [Eubacteriaceae bacterium]